MHLEDGLRTLRGLLSDEAGAKLALSSLSREERSRLIELAEPEDLDPLPWRKYELFLSIGAAVAEDEIHPDEEHTESEWSALTPQEQTAWLDEAAKGWVLDLIEYGWD